MAAQSISYRKDIDGLRALAVIFVVIFHAFPKALQGGFIGVDIFFVISGFLITSILAKEIQAEKFSLVSFYVRRINRIFPALIFMLSIVLFFGWWVLFSEEFRRLGWHVVGSGLFLANLIQWSEAGYFDLAALKKPLLHLWSLGIEEQFYIFWPALLLCFIKKYRSMVFCIFMLSFLLNIFLVKDYADSAFYAPFSRFWELLAGSILATKDFFLKEKWPNLLWLPKHGASVISFSGFVILVGSAILIKDSGFPGWWALFPVMGTVMIIGASSGWVSEKLLSSSVMVWFGLISYPLYLWHWPALSFINILGLKGDLYVFLAVAFSIFMAWATYKYLELPLKGLKKRSALLLSLNAIIVIFGVLVYTKVLPARLEGSNYESIAESRSDWEYPPVKAEEFKIGNYAAYRLAGKTNDEVLFLGDSNMQQFAPRVRFLVNSGSQYGAVFLARGGCRPVPKVASMTNNKCLSLADDALSYIEAGSVRRVVIAARWADFFNSDKYGVLINSQKVPLSDEKASRKAVALMVGFIRKIQQHGVEVFLVQNIPSGSELIDAMDQLNPLAVRLGISNEANYHGADEPTILTSGAIRANAREVILTIADATGAHVIDPISSLCGKEACPVMYGNNKLIYKDYTHLSASYVKQYAHFMDVTLEN